MKRFSLLSILCLLLLPVLAGAAGPNLATQPSEGFYYTQTITTLDTYAKLTSLMDTAWGSVQNYGKIGRALIVVGGSNAALISLGVGANGIPFQVGNNYWVTKQSEFKNIYLASATPGSAATVLVMIWHTKE